MVKLGVLGLLTLICTLFFCRAAIVRSASGRVFSEVDNVPERKVALVLGCIPELSNGRTNAFFSYRIQAAADLFHAGKVRYLLVSGDNHRKGYDEPTAMKEALVAKGVPGDRVVCDYAGFRTLDSVVRAQKVFEQEGFVVVSQQFHNQRAIYIARCKGLDAVGYNARDVSRRWALKTRLREQLARVKTVLDMYVLRTRPKFLGQPVPIGPEENRAS